MESWSTFWTRPTYPPVSSVPTDGYFGIDRMAAPKAPLSCLSRGYRSVPTDQISISNFSDLCRPYACFGSTHTHCPRLQAVAMLAKLVATAHVSHENIWWSTEKIQRAKRSVMLL